MAKSTFDIPITEESPGVFVVASAAKDAPPRGRPPADGMYIRLDAATNEKSNFSPGQRIQGLSKFCLSRLAMKGFTCLSLEDFSKLKTA